MTQHLRIALSYVEQKLKARAVDSLKNNDHVSKKRQREYLQERFAEGVSFIRKLQEHSEYGPVFKNLPRN
jgi:hypothetical protein